MARPDWLAVMGERGRAETLRFQFEMIKYRSGMGWSHKDLRNALMQKGNTYNPETGSLVWQMADVQQWCSLLGGRLVITYPGLAVPVGNDHDAMVQNLRALFAEDEYDRWYAVRYLAQVRVNQGISAKDMAARIGTSAGAVTGWENGTNNPIIASLMRHAYALGGDVRLDFEPEPVVQGPTGRKR